MDALWRKIVLSLMIYLPLYYKIDITSPTQYIFRHAISQLKLALFLIIINPFNTSDEDNNPSRSFRCFNRLFCLQLARWKIIRRLSRSPAQSLVLSLDRFYARHYCLSTCFLSNNENVHIISMERWLQRCSLPIFAIVSFL